MYDSGRTVGPAKSHVYNALRCNLEDSRMGRGDELYFRERAETEARLARAATHAKARAAHEELRRTYLERIAALRRDPPPSS